MLCDFFDYVKEQAAGDNSAKWLHWNMRDANYGFAALEHRFSVLGGIPFNIRDTDKVDLAVLLKEIYGRNYVPHPRFESLVNLNKLSMIGFMNGAAEAEAFDKREYAKLHQSTLKKVDLIAEVATFVVAGDLKTSATRRHQYGTSITGLYEGMVQSTAWKIVSVAAVLVTIGGGVVCSIGAFP